MTKLGTTEFIEEIEKTLSISIDEIGVARDIISDALRNRGAFLVFCDAAGGYWVSEVEEPTRESALESLDVIAEECWPGEGEWPRSSNEYCAWLITTRDRRAELVTGPCRSDVWF